MVEYAQLEPFTREGASVIRSSSGQTTQGWFSGIPILDLVYMFSGSSLPKQIIAEASDGYQVIYTLDWLEQQEGTWILAWGNEDGLLDLSQGPFRSVSIGDPPPITEGRRSARQVIRIIFGDSIL